MALTAESLLATERAAKESLMAQVRQLEADNRTLREDLGFFEKLIPAAKTDGLAVRALQAEVLGGMQLRWQVLVIQAARNAPEFNGRLELVLAGTLDGKPWTQTQLPQGQPLQVGNAAASRGCSICPPPGRGKNRDRACWRAPHRTHQPDHGRRIVRVDCGCADLVSMPSPDVHAVAAAHDLPICWHVFHSQAGFYTACSFRSLPTMFSRKNGHPSKAWWHRAPRSKAMCIL